jgi:hypothetical protein
MGMGEGLADLACYITDCDSRFESDEDRSPRGPSRDPEAVARRAAAVGECGDESTYDVDHWVSHGERRAPGPERTALPETVLLDDESPLFADPSEEYAAPAVEPLDADQQALLADWLKDTP